MAIDPQALVLRVRSKDYAAQIDAKDAGAAAVPELVSLLQDPDEEVRLLLYLLEDHARCHYVVGAGIAMNLGQGLNVEEWCQVVPGRQAIQHRGAAGPGADEAGVDESAKALHLWRIGEHAGSRLEASARGICNVCEWSR